LDKIARGDCFAGHRRIKRNEQLDIGMILGDSAD
jgi:hypothetical protein